MDKQHLINKNVIKQIEKVEMLLEDAKTKEKHISRTLLTVKAQTIITTIDMTFGGTGLLDIKLRNKLDNLYIMASDIMHEITI